MLKRRLQYKTNTFQQAASSQGKGGGRVRLQELTETMPLLTVFLCLCKLINPLIPTLKPHSNGTLYSNTVIGTLAVDGCAVTFGTARRGLGRLRQCNRTSSSILHGVNDNFLSGNKNLCEEGEMFRDSERVEENVVLRTKSQTLPDLHHVPSYVETVDPRRTRCRRQKPCSSHQVVMSNHHRRRRGCGRHGRGCHGRGRRGRHGRGCHGCGRSGRSCGRRGHGHGRGRGRRIIVIVIVIIIIIIIVGISLYCNDLVSEKEILPQ